MSEGNLESVVRELKARADIMDTMAHYCRCADGRDAEAMIKLFTDDCIVDFLHTGDAQGFHGKDALRAILVPSRIDTITGSHHISNESFTFDSAESVRFHCYLYSWERFAKFPVMADAHSWRRYEIHFVLRAGAWNIARLRLLSAGEYGGSRIGEHIGRPYPPHFD
jgi:hypothetical protein